MTPVWLPVDYDWDLRRLWSAAEIKTALATRVLQKELATSWSCDCWYRVRTDPGKSRKVTYLLNIWKFVYFVCGLSPKRRVVRWRNFACRRVTTMFRTCDGFYVYRGRRYENNDIFLKLRTCSLHYTFAAVAYTSWRAVAGWLQELLLIVLLLIAQAMAFAGPLAGWP